MVFEAIFPSVSPDAKWLQGLPPSHFRSSQNSCPICTEHAVEATGRTICGHVFHAKCLLDWFLSLQNNFGDSEYTCPMCRKVLAINEPDGQQCSGVKEAFEDILEPEPHYYQEDGDYLALRKEVEQELQYHYSQLHNLQETLWKDEESVQPQPTIFGGVAREAGGNGLLEEFTWLPIQGRFIPARSLGVEEEMEVIRCMYRTKVLMSDAVERVEKLEAMLGKEDVQIEFGSSKGGVSYL